MRIVYDFAFQAQCGKLTEDASERAMAVDDFAHTFFYPLTELANYLPYGKRRKGSFHWGRECYEPFFDETIYRMLVTNYLLGNASQTKSWREHLYIPDHTPAIAFEDVKNRNLLVLCVHFISHA